jgi:hypothetical protein
MISRDWSRKYFRLSPKACQGVTAKRRAAAVSRGGPHFVLRRGAKRCSTCRTQPGGLCVRDDKFLPT